MALYEHIFLARPEVSETRMRELISQYSDHVSKSGGKLGRKEYWGLRLLAYPVKRNKRAHYALIDIDADHKVIAEIERMQMLDTDVLRSLTVRVEEFEQGESVALQQKGQPEVTGARVPGRSDRPERGPHTPRPSHDSVSTDKDTSDDSQPDTAPEATA